MNNILIFTKTLEKYYNIIDQVLIIIEKNKLILQLKKCLFYQIKINYLSIIISKNSVEVDLTKIKKYQNNSNLKINPIIFRILQLLQMFC